MDYNNRSDVLALTQLSSSQQTVLISSIGGANGVLVEADLQPICIHVSDAIRAQGIDDVTSRTFVQILFGLVYGCLFALGLTGNGSVLWAVIQNKRLRSARNIFLLNLILTDLLLCLTGVPVTPWYALSKEWRFGSLMCRLMPLSNSCAVFVTSWSLTAIALDKFMHIIDPTREPFSVRLAGFITVLIWLICSLVNIPYLVLCKIAQNGLPEVTRNGFSKCGLWREFKHFPTSWLTETITCLKMPHLFVADFVTRSIGRGDPETALWLHGHALSGGLLFVVPMAIITYCYWRILAKVQKDMIIQNAQFSKSLTSSQRVDAINRKKRVNYILIGMVIAFIGCWLPMTAVNLVKDFKQEPGFMRTQPYLWPLMAHVIAMSTVIWNPLLFFWLTRKQKRSNLGGILTTSEIMTSLASRVHSLRSTGTGDSTNESRFKRRHQQSLDRETALATKTNNNSYTLLNNNNSSSATAKSTPYNHNNNWASPIASRNGEAHNGTVNGKDRRQHMLIQKAASLSSSQML